MGFLALTGRHWLGVETTVVPVGRHREHWRYAACVGIMAVQALLEQESQLGSNIESLKKEIEVGLGA